MKSPEVVYGVHPVLELLEAGRRRVEKIYVSRERKAGLGRVLKLAREAGIPVSHLPREVLASKVGHGALHQGIAARVAAYAYADAAELCHSAAKRKAALLVLLDRVLDPRNLGSILRTCAAAGVDGVILGGQGHVGLTAVVAKVSAGAVERVRVAREAKPRRLLEGLKDQGFSAVALDPLGSKIWTEMGATGRIVIVAGGEGRGLRPGLAELCDLRLAIPMAAGVESLNVAVALGVLLFEVVRQRRPKVPGP